MGKNKVGLSLNELHAQNKKIVYDKVLPYYEHYYVIVPDIASGTKKRYTVYKLSVTGKEATIVGRELDLKYANKFTDKLILQDIEHAKKLEERDKKYAYKNEKSMVKLG